MTTVIFLGPSLDIEKAKTILPNAIYLPPVQCGDIIRALHLQPDAIAIIDGYFEHSAAVWHKEILLALSKNIAVYGASSMGALRAAELTLFGMLGVGKIYEDFYSGLLNDDDEVAVVHRPVQSHYETITDAMVNIRATLQQAINEKIITTVVADNLLQHAKMQFYKQRNLQKTIDCYAQQHGEKNIKSLCDWLAQDNFIDQKKLDAIELLKTLSVETRFIASLLPHNTVNKTILLHKLNDRCQCEPAEHSTESEDTKRYTRLLAYVLKTSERLNIALPAAEQMYCTVQENDEMKKLFQCLFLLFDAPLFLQTDNKYPPILLLATALIFSVRKILQSEQVQLKPEQMNLYMNEIMQLLSKKTSPEQAKQLLLNADHQRLIDVYAILKDTINNGADAFLATNPVLPNQSYYTQAQQLSQTLKN